MKLPIDEKNRFDHQLGERIRGREFPKNKTKKQTSSSGNTFEAASNHKDWGALHGKSNTETLLEISAEEK